MASPQICTYYHKSICDDLCGFVDYLQLATTLQLLAARKKIIAQLLRQTRLWYYRRITKNGENKWKSKWESPALDAENA
jgi:hypothetical protein